MATHIGFAEGHESNSTGRTTLSTSTSLTLAVGDCVHVHIGFEAASVSGVSITGISDGLGNTYTQLERENHASQTDMASAHYECIVTSAGTATFTATWGSNVTYCHIEAFQGRPDSGKAFQSDVSTSGQSSTQGTAATAAGVAVDAPGYMSAGVKGYSDGNWTSAWGTELGALTAVNFAGAYLLTSVDQTETPEITTSNGTSWCIGAIHTKEVTAGGGGTMTCDVGTYTLVGQDVSFAENLAAGDDIGGLVVGSSTAYVGEGYVGANEAPPAGSPYTITCALGTYSLTGQVTALLFGRKLVADQGTYTLAGQDALVDLAMSCASGSYSLTGQAATLTYTPVGSLTLTADQGTYTLTGQPANLLYGRTLVADSGTYALTGQAVNTLLARVMAAAAGSYALTGQDVTLTYTPAGAFTLTADSGTYTLSGQAANLLAGRVMVAAQGAYSLNGQDVTLTYQPAGQLTMTADAGSYALSGQAANLLASRRMTADQGSYALTGFDATLQRVISMVAAAGSYVLSGFDAGLRAARRLLAELGVYGLAGQSVTLDYAGALQALGAGARRRMRVSGSRSAQAVAAGREAIEVSGGRGTQEVG